MHGRRIGAAAVAAAVALVGAGAGSGQTTRARAKAPLVVLVTDINQLNDHGFNHLAYVGLLRAHRRLGVSWAVYQSPSASDYTPNLALAARKGAALVISVGFDQAANIATVAKQFPKTHFAIIDVDQKTLTGKPKNVEGLLFTEQQVGYLAGYLAGLLEKSRAHAVIGSVGGQKQPPVDRYIAGYRAGAKKADPKISLLNAYSQDWVDQTKCKELALNEIAAGATVVFQVAGGCGLGVLSAAKDKGVWGIGVDADQSYLGPQVLTSAMKRVDNSVFQTVQQVLAGKFAGGTNAVFSLANGGVGLGTISPKVPKADVAKVRAIAKQIAEGRIRNIPTTVK
ncbi:MAG: BMP family lipoprotein [Gaiellaceae bacterium]